MAAPRGENVRGMILDAAARLLRGTDFGALSLAQIAAEAGVSKGTLYYYYSSKDDILFDVADRCLNGLLDEFLAWADNPEKNTGLPRLFGFVLERGVGAEFGNLRLYLIGASVSGHDALRQKYIDLYAQFQRTLAIRLAQRAPAADADFLAWLVLVLTDGLLIQNQLASPAFSEPAFRQKAAALLAGAAGKEL